jgi:hypothetical protein
MRFPKLLKVEENIRMEEEEGNGDTGKEMEIPGRK